MNTPAADAIAVRVHLDDSEDPPHSGGLLSDSVAALVRFVMREEGLSDADVDLVFCGDERIAELNRAWLDHPGPTDVLTFNLSGESETGGAKLEGEIYIDLMQASRQAPEFGATLDEEIRRLVIHGVLHLIGFDDAGEHGEAERMRSRQEELVAAWGEPLMQREVSG